MRLRKLQQKDAPFMLEWMHDETVVKNMQTDFFVKTIEDCKAFIAASHEAGAVLAQIVGTDCEGRIPCGLTGGKINDLHLAIAEDNDEYMGTISLKHIMNGTAEFAITVRKCAMGKGYSRAGMDDMLQLGFDTLKLKRIYWCVSPENIRAIRLYDENGYKRFNLTEDKLMNVISSERYGLAQINTYIWYKKEHKK